MFGGSFSQPTIIIHSRRCTFILVKVASSSLNAAPRRRALAHPVSCCLRIHLNSTRNIFSNHNHHKVVHHNHPNHSSYDYNNSMADPSPRHRNRRIPRNSIASNHPHRRRRRPPPHRPTSSNKARPSRTNRTPPFCVQNRPPTINTTDHRKRIAAASH